MAGKGPPKTPTAILERRGSWLAKTRQQEPTPGVATLEPPEWLQAEGLGLWRSLGPTLVAARILTATDEFTFALFCQAFAEFREAETLTTRERLYPLLLRFAKEFGLTPASRAGISALPAKAETGKDRFFKIVG
jgi:phage terminase small subunit